jgi:hypothetical protein
MRFTIIGTNMEHVKKIYTTIKNCQLKIGIQFVCILIVIPPGQNNNIKDDIPYVQIIDICFLLDKLGTL